MRLRGKHKPTYTPHIDCGDNIIVINAAKVKLTGNKYTDSLFHWHTGFPGGIRSRTPKQTIEGKYPERVLEKAIQRMMPHGPLAKKIFSNLRVYPGAEHPHAAQNPETLDVSALNPKNKR
jgi:large subunit ribosomal protein L13